MCEPNDSREDLVPAMFKPEYYLQQIREYSGNFREMDLIEPRPKHELCGHEDAWIRASAAHNYATALNWGMASPAMERMDLTIRRSSSC
jgi:hypothetical protein